MITKISVVYSAAPYIILEQDNIITSVGTKQEEIELNELGAYVSLMQQQQAALGKFVSCVKGTYTENGKQFPAIVFISTVNQQISSEKTVSFTLDTVAFGVARNLAAVSNCVKTSDSQVKRQLVPFVISCSLPRTSANFWDDYTWDEMNMLAGVAAEAQPGTWDVFLMINDSGDTISTINFNTVAP